MSLSKEETRTLAIILDKSSSIELMALKELITSLLNDRMVVAGQQLGLMKKED